MISTCIMVSDAAKPLPAHPIKRNSLLSWQISYSALSKLPHWFSSSPLSRLYSAYQCTRTPLDKYIWLYLLAIFNINLHWPLMAGRSCVFQNCNLLILPRWCTRLTRPLWHMPKWVDKLKYLHSWSGYALGKVFTTKAINRAIDRDKVKNAGGNDHTGKLNGVYTACTPKGCLIIFSSTPVVYLQ